MAAKKVSKKKSVSKKKTASKKTASKKTPTKKAPVKKAPVKKKAVSKKASAKKKTTAQKSSAKKKSAQKVPEAVKKVKRFPIESIEAREVIPRKVFKAKEIAKFKDLLLTLRERVSGEYSSLSRDNMAANQRDPSLSDQGTDTFDREMELNMMGSEQEVLFEIDAALRRIEKGTYGICELTEEVIPKARLEALPYVRYTVEAQSKLEQGRARFRPFGGTLHG